MGNEIIINEDNFEKEVLQAGTPVLVDFWAPWCGPCRMLAPTIEAIADEYSGKVKVAKCNVDENGDIAQKYGIVSIPTLIIFSEGKVVKEDVGVKSQEEIVELFSDLI